METLSIKIERQEAVVSYLESVRTNLVSMMEQLPKMDTNEPECCLSLYEKLYRMKVAVVEMEREQRCWLDRYRIMEKAQSNDSDEAENEQER